MFSPYYAWARRAGRADPDNHVAVNVALYANSGYRWAMTERGRASLRRTANQLTIGGSSIVAMTDGSFDIVLDEVCVPLPRRVKGRLRIWPRCAIGSALELAPVGGHVWQPISPVARIEVALEHPARTWSGSAYIDHNRGAEPLETRFRRWSWARTVEHSRTRIYYDTVLRDGGRGHHHLSFGVDGRCLAIAAPELQPAGRTAWRIHLEARSDCGHRPRRIKTWEDGPFYARSLMSCMINREQLQAIHETVSLDRFRRPPVQCLLPFRMPRRTW